MRLAWAVLALFCTTGATFAVKPFAGAQKSNRTHAHDFIIFATVLNEQGFALSGARARVRGSLEKKYRWEAMSDRQGEVAFRVPPGAEYELTIEARGFKTQSRKIDATEDHRTDLTIRMETGTGGKS